MTAARHALVLGLDTLGDLLLRQPLLTGLLDRGWHVTFVVRPPFAPLVPRLDRRLGCFESTVDPYVPGDEHLPRRVRELADALRALSPDCVVCAPFNRTAVDETLLTAFDDRPRFGLTPHGVAADPLLTTAVSVLESSPETVKNRALFAALTGEDVVLPAPRLDLDADDRARARGALERLGIAEGAAYAVGAPAGTVTTALKAWPADEFAGTIVHLEGRHALPVVLVGVAAEQAHLDDVARRARALGAAPRVWVGAGRDDLGTLLGLVAASRLYVGSDSGPMHFAAALDVPVVARFGGGHWPRFLPAAARGRVVTQRLPCFGCGWLCWLSEPACIRAVAPEAVTRAIDDLLAGGTGFAVDEGRAVDAWSAGLIEDGAARYRTLAREHPRAAGLANKLAVSEADRAARLDVIEAQQVRLVGQLRTLDDLHGRLAASEADRAARLQAIDRMAREARAQQEQIAQLTTQVAHLTSIGGAVRALAAAGLRKAGLYELAWRRRQVLNRVLPSLPTLVARDPEAGAAPGLPRPTLLEAFATGNAMGSALHELALERLYQRGDGIGRVLCVGDSRETLAAAYMLAAGGAVVTLQGADVPAGVQIPGLEGDARCLADRLAASGPDALRAWQAIVLDPACGQETLRLVTSRVPEGTRLLVLGAPPAAVAAEPVIAEAPGLHALEQVPGAWLDARPRRLPSGRSWPRITVVTVCFNHAAFLEDTLRSVLDQDYPDVEYIVIDGGSTDGSVEIMERYRDRLAYCVSEPDRGQSHALNKGFARATGSVLAWLNSDDAYPPDALWRAALALDVYDADVVAGGCALFDQATGLTTRVHHSALPVGRTVPLPAERLLDLDGAWLQGDFFYQPEVFWTREIWQRVGGRVAEELHYSMDYDLWVRMALAGARVVHVPDTLARYRVHEGQKTAGTDLPYLPELRRVAAGFQPVGAAR